MSRLGGRAIARMITLVDKTSSRTYEPADLPTWAAAHHPFILACWHGQFMMLSTLNRGIGIDIAAMVARHGDAELIGEAMRQFDVTLVRGAGAGHRKKDRGGSYALRACTRELQDGKTVVMTADVPPGPARRAGLGIIQLARMSGRPIIPIAPATSRFKSLRTWSRLTFNLPFSKLAFVAGDPIHVPRNADAEALETARQLLEDRLTTATNRAYELAGRDAARITPNHALPAEAQQPAVSTTLKTYRAAAQALRFAAPAVLKRRERRGKEDPGRRGERLGQPSEPRKEGCYIWLHAASVGETNAITPIITGIKARRPDLNILLTTGTTTSAEIAEQRLSGVATHQYVPIDVPNYARSFLNHWKPELAVLTESEIWPNIILETKARDIPIALVNGRLSARSFSRWKSRLKTAEALFGRLDTVLCQDKIMAYRFGELGCRNVLQTGNLKYDADPPPIDGHALNELQAAIGETPVWLAASTHDPEEYEIGQAHRLMAPRLSGLLTIIIPRHPARGVRISEHLKMQGLKVAQRSDGALPDSSTDIYLADTLGELGTFYALAPVAFIGGSLSETGGHNPIEAIKHDCAVITGPNIKNFGETYAKLKAGLAAVEVRSTDEIADITQQLLTDSAKRQEQLIRAKNIVESESGGLEQALSELLLLLEPHSNSQITSQPQQPEQNESTDLPQTDAETATATETETPNPNEPATTGTGLERVS
ncbi:MAG: glycosyltransferase N-terminal domain-containing protein [Pseudomonadota bacterium]